MFLCRTDKGSPHLSVYLSYITRHKCIVCAKVLGNLPAFLDLILQKSSFLCSLGWYRSFQGVTELVLEPSWCNSYNFFYYYECFFQEILTLFVESHLCFKFFWKKKYCSTRILTAPATLSPLDESLWFNTHITIVHYQPNHVKLIQKVFPPSTSAFTISKYKKSLKLDVSFVD